MKLMNKAQDDEKGFVLVLALFMLTICTIIGMAAMNTSITEVDIAGNEKVHKEISYQTEAGFVTVVAELFKKNAYGVWSTEELDELEAKGIEIQPPCDFLTEGRDDAPLNSGKWEKEKQEIDAVDDKPKKDSIYNTPDIKIRINNQYNLDMDVDKVDARYIAGGGVEFAAGAEGIGVSTHRIIYNIDCIGTLPSRNLRQTDGTINPATPLAEVIVGYGYVPW